MNKLIKLLNEYEKWKGEEYGRGNYVWGIDKENKSIFASRFPDGAYICEEESRAIIICKGYEFIKRLVEKDKIDISPYEYKIGTGRIGENNRDMWYDEYSNYEKALMLLAIQDNPIEFLISILK